MPSGHFTATMPWGCLLIHHWEVPCPRSAGPRPLRCPCGSWLGSHGPLLEEPGHPESGRTTRNGRCRPHKASLGLGPCCSNCRLGGLRLDPGILILFPASGCKGPNVMPEGVLLPARECLLSVLAGLLSFCLPSPTYLVRSKFPGCKVHPNVRAWRQTYQPTSLPQLPPSQGSQKENRTGHWPLQTTSKKKLPQPLIQAANVLSSRKSKAGLRHCSGNSVHTEPLQGDSEEPWV